MQVASFFVAHNGGEFVVITRDSGARNKWEMCVSERTSKGHGRS
jgi:hypothetical protein